LWNVRAEDLGIHMEHVLLATVDLESAGYKAADRTAFFERAMQRLRTLPGVENAAMAESYPFSSVSAVAVIVPGRPDSIPGAHGGLPTYNVVSPGFFATLGMHITRGRGFGGVGGNSSRYVAVIDETMAHTVWPDEDPLGKCIRLGSQNACTTIIGVVKDARRFRIREEPTMQLYVPFGQDRGTATTLLLRTRGDLALLEGAVRRTLQSLAPNLPYADVHPMQDLLNPQIRPWTLGATMFGIFGLLALVVASVGLYSVLAYDVAQRVHEMGVRMALGARAPDVVRLVLGDSLRVAAIGIVLGLVATLAAGRAIASLLFDTSPHDPTVLGIVCVTLLVVAVLASLLPAWRATRVDPSTALRAE
jgi:predicted permease